MQFPVLSIIVFTPAVAGLLILLIPANRKTETRSDSAGCGGDCVNICRFGFTSITTNRWRVINLSRSIDGFPKWVSACKWAWMG